MRNHWVTWLICVVAFPLSMLGCDDKKDVVPDDNSPPAILQVLSWWFKAGDADALNVLLEKYKTTTGGEVDNQALENNTLVDTRMNELIAAGEPGPDILLVGGGTFYDWLEFGDPPQNMLRSLEDWYDTAGWRDVVHPSIIQDVTYNGTIYSIPNSIHRHNALFYNKRLYSEYGRALPTTMSEFFAELQFFVDNGITSPLIIATSKYVQYTFDCLMLANLGSAEYARAYFAGEKTPTDPLMDHVVDDFAQLMPYLDPNYANVARADVPQAFAEKTYAFFMSADWQKGAFDSKGQTADVDYGVMACPGTQYAFLYTLDAFVVPASAANERGAELLANVILDPETQVAFGKVKGSLPVRIDADPTTFKDDAVRAAYDDFKAAQLAIHVRRIEPWRETIYKALQDYVAGSKTADEVKQVIHDSYSLLPAQM